MIKRIVDSVPVNYRAFVAAAVLIVSHFWPGAWSRLDEWIHLHGETLLTAGGLVWAGWQKLQSPNVEQKSNENS